MAVLPASYNYLKNYLDELRSKGKYSFTYWEIKRRFKISAEAIVKSVQRLKKKGKIAHIRKEFYVVVPPEYSATGTLPTVLYIDDLMKYLEKDYYVGLLSAAALHGAAHQQPMVFFVMNKKHSLRNISNKYATINFSFKKKWNKKDIVQKKTDAGYINVSSPELTALDIVYFIDNVGGLNRVATILDELAEEVNAEKLADTANRYGQIATVQRLGFMLEEVLHYKEKTEPLYNWLKNENYYPVFLKAGKKTKKMNANNRWRVIKNFSPESDL